MGFEHFFRLSAHAVITDGDGHVLQLRATYGEQRWGLPGGALDPGETVTEALLREVREELGTAPTIGYLSGIYYHAGPNSHAFIFRCTLPAGTTPVLSAEHSEWRYFPLDALSPVQRHRVEDCLGYDGTLRTGRF